MITSIGLVRLSALGDVALVVPTVKALQAHFPEAAITWIIGRAAYALVSGLPNVRFIVIDKPKCFSDYLHFKRLLAHQHFDVLLAMQASLRANLLYPFISAKRKIGFDKRRATDFHRLFIHESIPEGSDHLLDAFMRFACVLGVRSGTCAWDLPLSEADYAWAHALLREGPWMACHLQASQPERNWALSRYIALISEVQKRWDVGIVLTGGSSLSEIAAGFEVEKTIQGRYLNCIAQTTPKKLAALLGRVQVLVSPDTVSVHLASAMRTPVVGLYAVAPPQLSGPYFSSALTINKFPEAVRTLLKKAPNKLPWRTRVHHKEAMDLISVEEVLEKLGSVFDRGSPIPNRNTFHFG